MSSEQLLIGGIAFLQWLIVPLCMRGVQNYTSKITGWHNVLQDTMVALIVYGLVTLVPLWMLDFIPLGSASKTYFVAALLGGVLSAPLTTWMRNRGGPNGPFR